MILEAILNIGINHLLLLLNVFFFPKLIVLTNVLGSHDHFLKTKPGALSIVTLEFTTTYCHTPFHIIS